MQFYFEWNLRICVLLDISVKIGIIKRMENITLVIGENIAALRKANNLTQQQLADKLNYSNKAVSRWEKGECLPSVETLSALCEYFGVEFEYLIRRHEMPAVIKKKAADPNKIAIALLTCLTVFTVATVVFVYVKVVHNINYWQAFVWGAPVSAFLVMELGRKWSWNKVIKLSLSSFFLWSLITAAFLTVMSIVNVWPVYLIGIPLQVIFILLFFVPKYEENDK